MAEQNKHLKSKLAPCFHIGHPDARAATAGDQHHPGAGRRGRHTGLSHAVRRLVPVPAIMATLFVTLLPLFPAHASGRTVTLTSSSTTTAMVEITIHGLENSSGTGILRNEATNKTYPVAWDQVIYGCCHWSLVVRTYSYITGHYRQLTSIGEMAENCIPSCGGSVAMNYGRIWYDEQHDGFVPPKHVTLYFVRG